MEKVERITRTTFKNIHHFYCDDCGCYLGATEEYDDGWVADKGKFELTFHVVPHRYSIQKHLCDECRTKILSKIADNLIQLGFEKR